jgi:hypothetical protein
MGRKGSAHETDTIPLTAYFWIELLENGPENCLISPGGTLRFWVKPFAFQHPLETALAGRFGPQLAPTQVLRMF